jgi:hypothetical protein
MAGREKNFFSDGEISALRRGFYTQAPTVAAMLLDESEDVDAAAELTVQLIEALVSLIADIQT